MIKLRHESSPNQELNHPYFSRPLGQGLPTLNKEKNRSSHKPAFTIIEVVLVLAIAGLIFFMVFIALPALQRNQRDTQRKRDTDRVLSAIQRYQSNNRGVAPNFATMGENLRGPAENVPFAQNYLLSGGDKFSDPNGRSYILWRPNTLAIVNDGTSLQFTSDGGNYTPIYYFYSARCEGERAVASGSSNNMIILVVLEGGGRYCINN